MTSTKTVAALSANEAKRAVATRMIQIVARELASGKQIPGVKREDALQWAGEWLNYLPGVRQGATEWDKRLGRITGAGAAKPATTTRKGAAQKSGTKPAAGKTPASKTGAKPATRSTSRTAKPAGVTTRTHKPATTAKPATPASPASTAPAAQVA